MKKKVLFMVINMNIGGTEKALLNMIEDMPEEEYDITVLMLEKYGGFLDYIPERVKVEYLKEYSKVKKMFHDPPFHTALGLMKSGKMKKGIAIAFFHFLFKVTKDRALFLKCVFREIPKHKNKYDIAIAYAGPMDFISYFIAEKVEAKKKIQWIHFDVTKIGFHKRFAAKLYSEFDNIYTVSNEGRDKLIEMVPDLKSKTEVYKNIVSPGQLIKLADKDPGFNDQFDGIRILTVGRLSKEKGQDIIISVLARLKQDGHNVRWYCVGEGSARREYEALIKGYGVEKEFILLGATPNPYPFMKQCDLYVQPSRHEGYCITLAEVLCFHKPIISTNFAGAKEQLIHNSSGTVVEVNQDKIYRAVKQFLADREESGDYPGKSVFSV